MNKLIIVESGDGLGKGTLIKGLCEHFDYKNITVRHCDKPPRELSPSECSQFQFECFEQEFSLVDYLNRMDRNHSYHDNITIFDRFYPGEYVYSFMFRGGNVEDLKYRISALEERHLTDKSDVYLVTLTADPTFFLNQEDGQSFSKNLDEKTKELKLFKEIHEFSVIKNKLLVKVDYAGEFRYKENILHEVINFIEQ